MKNDDGQASKPSKAGGYAALAAGVVDELVEHEHEALGVLVVGEGQRDPGLGSPDLDPAGAGVDFEPAAEVVNVLLGVLQLARPVETDIALGVGEAHGENFWNGVVGHISL